MNKNLIVLIICLLALFGCKNDKNNSKVSNDVKPIAIDSVETIESLSQKIRQNLMDADLFLKRSELYMAERNMEEAIADAELALKIDSLRPDIYIRISDYNLTKGQSEQAKDILVKAIEKFPMNHEVRLRLAYIYYYVDMHNSSMDQIKFLEENNLQEAETYLLKAMLFKDANRYDDAINSLKKAIEYKNDFWEAYDLLGMLYSRKNDEMAVEYFKTATRLFPDNLEIRYHAGYVYQQFEYVEEAVGEYEYVIAKDSEYFYAYFNLGNIYINYYRDYPKAIEYISEAIEIDPLSYEAYYNRGIACEMMNNYKMAENNYREALKIMPNYDPAVTALNEVLEK